MGKARTLAQVYRQFGEVDAAGATTEVLLRMAPQANRAICRILFIASSAATLYASARVG